MGANTSPPEDYVQVWISPGFSPLCGFYFIGECSKRIRRTTFSARCSCGASSGMEDLFGWSFILPPSTVLSATPATVLGVPAHTALVLSLGMAGIRRASGLDLKVQTDGGQLLVVNTGATVGGFIVLDTVFVDAFPAI